MRGITTGFWILDYSCQPWKSGTGYGLHLASLRKRLATHKGCRCFNSLDTLHTLSYTLIHPISLLVVKTSRLSQERRLKGLRKLSASETGKGGGQLLPAPLTKTCSTGFPSTIFKVRNCQKLHSHFGLMPLMPILDTSGMNLKII